MSGKVDLDPEYIAIVKKILQRHLPVHANIWLFGSRARGDAKKYSDIDLLIDLGKPISLDLLTKLNMDFEESDLPYKVDVADARSISEAFRKNIQGQLISLNCI
jgi:predicted nucleotidyltransferase